MPRAVGDGDKLFILLWWELASSEQSVLFRLETAVAGFYWNFSGGGKKKQKNQAKIGMFATKVSVFESQLLQRWSFKRERYVRVRKRRGCSETKYAVFQPQLWSNVICVAAGQVKNIFLQPKKEMEKNLQKTQKKCKRRGFHSNKA